MQLNFRDRTLGLRDISMLLVWLAVVAYFGFADPTFLSPRNLTQLAIELSITAVLALGMLLIILPGHIDLSVGSGLGLMGGIAAVLVFHQGWPAPLALALATVVSILVYAGMGTIIVKERIPAFIITLGGLLVFKGLHWLVIQNSTVPVSAGGATNLYSLVTTYYLPPEVSLVLAGSLILLLVLVRVRAHHRRRARGYRADDTETGFLKLLFASQLILLFVLVMNRYQGLPISVLLLGAIAAAIHVLTRHTPFGRYLYAIGGNEEAAVLSGIPTRSVVIGAFVLMGAIVALTGFLQTAYAGASTTTTGQLMELDAIAACVIGGASLKGGRGSVIGVLFGALIMATLLNGMTLLAISPESKFIARGLVLSLAVWMDVRLSRRSGPLALTG